MALRSPQFGDRLQTAQAGQIVVEEHQVEFDRARQRERLCALARLGYLKREARCGQNLAHDAAHGRRVVYQQHTAWEAKPDRAGDQAVRIVLVHRPTGLTVGWKEPESSGAQSAMV